ncbi:hypothetical protein H5410_049806, partial [Solanum commersonii]
MGSYNLKSKLGQKMERKYVEKNRRNYMKNLYNQLHSMLPTTKVRNNDSAKSNRCSSELHRKLENKFGEEQEALGRVENGPKMGQSFNPTNEPGPTIKSTPQIEFHEMGPNRMEFKATTLYDKMKELIYGASCSNDMECSQIHLWDYIIEFDELEVLPITPSQNPSAIHRNSTMEFRATTLCDKMEDYKIGYDALELLTTKSKNPNMYSYMQNETTKTVPDQIDAAVNYIESLKVKLEKSKKHLEELKMGQKRAQSLNQTNEPGPITNSPPQIELHEMGPTMVVVLISGLNNIATFNNIIRLCHKEGVEVVCTNFKLNGNSTLQISHETKINRSSTMEFSATTLCDKMKELIYGPSHGNDVDSQLHLWDYKIEFDALELLSTRSQNQN